VKKLNRISLCFLAVLVFICTISVNCFAASPACSLSVKLADSNKKPIDNLTVFAAKIADIEGENYVLSAGLEGSAISLAAVVNDPSAKNAKDLADYVKKSKLPALSAVSETGRAEFKAIKEGIYVVYCEENGEYKFNPFIAFLPYSVNGKLSYNVTSTPKAEPNLPNSKSIYVVKHWEDRNNIAFTRPESITVELKKDNKVVASAKLSKENGWAYTFKNLDNNASYTIEEKKVKDYTPKYNGDSENGFVITNVYSGDKLPDTGDNVNSVGWLLVLAISLAAVGIFRQRKAE
jgi:hypothetical protein